MPQEVYIASIVFFIISVIGLMTVIQTIFSPTYFSKFLSRVSGINLTDIAGKNEDNYKALIFLYRYISSVMLGSNLLTLIISLTAFRQLQQWAWYAMWYWPVMFLWHIMIYKRGTILWYIQIFWLIVSAGVLVWTKSIFFS